MTELVYESDRDNGDHEAEVSCVGDAERPGGEDGTNTVIGEGDAGVEPAGVGNDNGTQRDAGDQENNGEDFAVF